MLGAQLARLERRSEAAKAERRRLVDLYQAGMIELVDPQHRAKELDGRRARLTISAKRCRRNATP